MRSNKAPLATKAHHHHHHHTTPSNQCHLLLMLPGEEPARESILAALWLPPSFSLFLTRRLSLPLSLTLAYLNIRLFLCGRYFSFVTLTTIGLG